MILGMAIAMLVIACIAIISIIVMAFTKKHKVLDNILIGIHFGCIFMNWVLAMFLVIRLV